MIIGLNLKLNVFQITELADDEVGGAVPTGTYVGWVWARLDEIPTSAILMSQGIENMQLIQAEIQHSAVPISENDQVEVIFPANHRFLNQRLKVREIRSSSMNPSDPRHFRAAMLARIIQSRRVP